MKLVTKYTYVYSLNKLPNSEFMIFFLILKTKECSYSKTDFNDIFQKKE